MIGTVKIFFVSLLAVAVLGGCGQGGCAGMRSPCETTAKIGLIEQVESQQARIESLELAVEELYWNSRQTQIETLQWEIEQLRQMNQEERIEALEWKIAELTEK